MQFGEPGERGVEVCLVEDLAAVDHVGFKRVNEDPAPLGIEALWRGLVDGMGEDGSKLAQAMHGFDLHPDIRCDIPHRAKV